jgi:hypothetical protein
MLGGLADFHNTSMSDVIRRMIKNGFRKEFGDTCTCGTCCETHVLKDPIDAGWNATIDESRAMVWTCPRCQEEQK